MTGWQTAFTVIPLMALGLMLPVAGYRWWWRRRLGEVLPPQLRFEGQLAAVAPEGEGAWAELRCSAQESQLIYFGAELAADARSGRWLTVDCLLQPTMRQCHYRSSAAGERYRVMHLVSGVWPRPSRWALPGLMVLLVAALAAHDCRSGCTRCYVLPWASFYDEPGTDRVSISPVRAEVLDYEQYWMPHPAVQQVTFLGPAVSEWLHLGPPGCDIEIRLCREGALWPDQLIAFNDLPLERCDSQYRACVLLRGGRVKAEVRRPGL